MKRLLHCHVPGVFFLIIPSMLLFVLMFKCVITCFIRLRLKLWSVYYVLIYVYERWHISFIVPIKHIHWYLIHQHGDCIPHSRQRSKVAAQKVFTQTIKYLFLSSFYIPHFPFHSSSYPLTNPFWVLVLMRNSNVPKTNMNW